MKVLISAVLALACAACFAPKEEPSLNALYEPFLDEPAGIPSTPTSVTLAYFDIDFDSRSAPSIYLAIAESRAFSETAVIEKMFGNFLISSSVSQYGPFNLNSRLYPSVIWRARSRALWNEDQVLGLLQEQEYFAQEATDVNSDLGFGYITKTTASFEALHSTLSSRLVSEKVSDNCYFYRHEQVDTKRIITGFAIRDADGVLNLYDHETIECVGQFLAKSMGLTVSQEQILALTGFDQQADRGRIQPLFGSDGEVGGSAAEGEPKPTSRSNFPIVEVQPDQDYLQRLAEGGCVLASVIQKSASRNQSDLAYSGCPTAPSAAAIAFPYFVYGKESGRDESSPDRISKINEICRKSVASVSVQETFCEY
jgi:hypothetical protein